ncbi:MAG: N-acetyl sugar amidotransferase [bacterium]
MYKEKLVAAYGLPLEVKFCKRCVISNQRPSSVVEFKNKAADNKPTIAFDEEGVCAACRYAEQKEKINWMDREKELVELCDRYRSKDGSYDCIVPGSGGKDSSFTAHVLKFKYGMNPLTVTWAPHMYTEVGWQNFQHWISSGLDNMLYSPNGKIHRFLTKLAFINLVNPFQIFAIGQKLSGPRFSLLYHVPLVFYGENQAEYGNNIVENARPTMDMSFFINASRKLNEIYLGGISAKELIEKHGVVLNDLNPYLPLDPDRLKETSTQVHYLGYYLKWDPQECFYYAAEHTGFQANSERTEGSYSKYSSVDDRLDPLHYYTTLIKFGIGRATYDAAQEIRNGKINRDEGVTLVRRYDAEFPAKYFKEILEYLDISEGKFWEVIEKARPAHLWEKRGGKWTLKYQVS